jgi:hypothetical protein
VVLQVEHACCVYWKHARAMLVWASWLAPGGWHFKTMRALYLAISPKDIDRLQPGFTLASLSLAVLLWIRLYCYDVVAVAHGV